MKLTKDNYVKLAEKAILNLKAKKDRKGVVTTSKIRNLLAMAADIYNEVINSQSEVLSEEIKGQINYMKIRFVYESGRETTVKNFVEQAEILAHIDEIGDSREQYILFNRYMEALVAYRKFYVEHDE